MHRNVVVDSLVVEMFTPVLYILICFLVFG